MKDSQPSLTAPPTLLPTSPLQLRGRTARLFDMMHSYTDNPGPQAATGRCAMLLLSADAKSLNVILNQCNEEHVTANLIPRLGGKQLAWGNVQDYNNMLLRFCDDIANQRNEGAGGGGTEYTRRGRQHGLHGVVVEPHAVAESVAGVLRVHGAAEPVRMCGCADM